MMQAAPLPGAVRAPARLHAALTVRLAPDDGDTVRNRHPKRACAERNMPPAAVGKYPSLKMSS
ncbi:hypothetical protein WS86_26430 [Burkholderia savannae]|nr:hypothetical protein WS86_26430 [Burkholderia savannae]